MLLFGLLRVGLLDCCLISGVCFAWFCLLWFCELWVSLFVFLGVVQFVFWCFKFSLLWLFCWGVDYFCWCVLMFAV